MSDGNFIFHIAFFVNHTLAQEQIAVHTLVEASLPGMEKKK